MTREKKLWLNQTINVIEKLVSENAVSESFVHFAPSEFKSLDEEAQNELLKDIFNNSCSYVQLCYELRQFTTTLRNMIKFSEMSESHE